VPSAHPQYLDDDAFASLAVELSVEHALPGPQVKAAAGHRQRRLMMQQEGLQMRVPIIFAGLMIVYSRLGPEPVLQAISLYRQSTRSPGR